MNTYQRSVLVGLLCLGVALFAAGAVFAQYIVPPNYPIFRPDPNDAPIWVTLENDYIQCNVGIQGNVKTFTEFDDSADGNGKWGRGDKVPSINENNWHVSGRYGIVAKKGDPEITEDNDLPLTFMGFLPCHYFAYWKLCVGNDPVTKRPIMRMIGDGASGSWYNQGGGQPVYNPTLYTIPPPDLVNKEPGLGRTGPFIRGIWQTTGGNGSTILTEIRVHLVRDLVRFEYRITNMGTVSENVGFEQNGDVETGAPAIRTNDDGGYYGPYDNRGYAFIQGIGAAQPITKQRAMVFGGSDPTDPTGKTLFPPVPDWFEVYDDVQSPISVTRNVLGLEDATKPDVVAIGEYNDLFHKDLWMPTDYKPDKLHNILDMAWVLAWNQKSLAPLTTRTLITYYGIGASTSRWTYRSGKNAVRDSAVLSVQAPRSLKYDSTSVLPPAPEIAPASFSVKAYVYNLATDPGPYELRDATATISLPKGLQLVPGIPGNDASQPIDEVIAVNSESTPIEWKVMATGDYVGELPIYVSVVDNDPSGRFWQQSDIRNIYVPAVKRGHFDYGWQLMHVPFEFNNPGISYVFGLTPGTFGAQYFDAVRKVYAPVVQLKPGQAFWMFVDGLSWNQTRTFYLVSDAKIVGKAAKQTQEQHLQLARGWNMIGNPFVYPVFWGQVLVYLSGDTVTLDTAVSRNWMDKTLFSWNTSKWDYDITSDKGTMLNPWKGYWVNAKQPVTLIFRPPVVPEGDVTANSSGN
jgi:hypothetical protein